MNQVLRVSTFIFVAILLNSCGSSEQNTVSSEVEIIRTEIVGEEVKTIANIEIEGMVCEMACVGRVEKGINSMECVSALDMDFDPERDVDIATVTFDPTVCSAENMIETIHAIGDGSYQVKGLEVISYKN